MQKLDTQNMKTVTAEIGQVGFSQQKVTRFFYFTKIIHTHIIVYNAIFVQLIQKMDSTFQEGF